MSKEKKQPATRGAHTPSDIAETDSENRTDKQPYATEHEDYSGERKASPGNNNDSGNSERPKR